LIVIDRVLYRLSHGVEKRPSLRIVVCWQHAFGCTDHENGLFGVVDPQPPLCMAPLGLAGRQYA
jgi:hypothetical protein